jgi:hypothetical protein
MTQWKVGDSVSQRMRVYLSSNLCVAVAALTAAYPQMVSNLNDTLDEEFRELMKVIAQ